MRNIRLKPSYTGWMMKTRAALVSLVNKSLKQRQTLKAKFEMKNRRKKSLLLVNMLINIKDKIIMEQESKQRFL